MRFRNLDDSRIERRTATVEHFEFITRSTIQTKETAEKDGKTYPLVKMDTSSASHNFYTGEQRIMDTAGRVDKFRQKFGNRAGGKIA